ncbi:hypothetical protein BN2476_430011 [Paraburkholderia piptadeniae]|uniref:Uncharacterized protein n=1 Tax=Paraburkholderia piptadeniae TaxID=1701573 RepID=A0A1N7SBF0_9BURK|nr:hypothetical protein BN2476_430011 [Paraburkholderia piptadeniae]
MRQVTEKGKSVCQFTQSAADGPGSSASTAIPRPARNSSCNKAADSGPAGQACRDAGVVCRGPEASRTVRLTAAGRMTRDKPGDRPLRHRDRRYAWGRSNGNMVRTLHNLKRAGTATKRAQI